MEENEENVLVSKDDLLARLDRLLNWISSCDTKSSIVIAGVGLFLTIFTSEHSFNMLKTILTKTIDHMYVFNVVYLIGFSIALLFFAYGSYCLIRVLVPRLSKDLKKIENTYNDSLYYFESISKNSFLEFENKIKNRNEHTDIKDILSQIYINSRICTIKYAYYSKGIKHVFIGTVGLLCLFLFGIILMKLGGL